MFQDGESAVCTSIIDNDHLVIIEILREDAVETPLQVGFGVVGWYDDGEYHLFIKQNGKDN